MNWIVLERGGFLAGAYFFARNWAKWRTDRKERAALAAPLVDAAILEAVFNPRPKDGDDADLLAELRETFAHLNRRAYAEEFWGLHVQIAALDTKLGAPQKGTLRRAALRLLMANDRWLQLVGAKTSADLKMTEAIPPLRALLELAVSEDQRYRQELEEALAALTK